MSRKRYTPEQIIGMLRAAEVRLSQGQTVGEISRSLGISEQSCFKQIAAVAQLTGVLMSADLQEIAVPKGNE